VPASLIEDLREARAGQRGAAAWARGGGYGPAGTGGRAGRLDGRPGAGAAGQGPAGAPGAAAAHRFNSGDKVRHAKFGIGTVVSVQPSGSDTILTVAFPGEGVKRLMLSMAPLEPV